MEGAAKDIFVISDLHLGDGGARDNFESGGKTTDLRAFLDHVGSEGGELFVLGDLFELWQMNMSALFVKRKALLDHLASLPFIYVPGNHDVDLAHFIDTDFLGHPFFDHMAAPFTRELGGKQFRFFHGHETDPFNAGDDPGFGRMLAIFAGIFEDRNGSPFLVSGESVEDVLEQFGDSMVTLWASAMIAIGNRTSGKEPSPEESLTPVQNPHRLSEHVAEIRADRERRAYDVAVLGHTHKPGHIGDWYLNSGSWTGRKNSFLRISAEGHARYLHWKNGSAVEEEMPVVLAEAAPDGRHIVPTNPIEAAVSAARTFFPKPKKPERSRWLLMIQGALALAVGAGAFVVSVRQGAFGGLRVLVTAFGAYALLDGALSLVAASREQPLKRLLYRLRGALSLLLGVVVLRRGYVVDIFVILIGVWAFMTGALRVAAALVLKRMVDSKWLLLAGAGSMLAGLVLLLWPTSSVLLKVGLSGYLCYYGMGEFLAGLFGQRRL